MTVTTWLQNEPTSVASWLVSQRWFGDKSRTIERISATELGQVELEGTAVSLQRLTVEFSQGEPSVYFAPLALDASGNAIDAVQLPAFRAWLASGFEGEPLPSPAVSGGSIEWSSAGQDATWTSQPSRLLSGEQSNSSILFGEQAILKVFRKYQAGINPDSEIVAFLTNHGGFANVPAFLGSVNYHDAATSEPVELATVQALVQNQGDCWRWLPPALVASVGQDRTALTEAVGLLGFRTGELHVALAGGEEPAFALEAFSDADASDFGERLAREIRLTGSMLFQHGALSEVAHEEMVGGLQANAMDTDLLAGSTRMRVHGDYHLGQVLRTGDDFVIIDFEGEPSRTMEERRQKHSPLKDVAGMVRSIDYACAAASESLTPSEAADLREWGQLASKAFVDRYREAVLASDTGIIARDLARFDAMLDLFMTEKALYEVRYELDNRPDWLDIPLSALQRIAAKR